MYILDKFYSGLDQKIIYGAKCSKCEKVYFPPKIICQECFEKTIELIELPPTGIIKNYVKSMDLKKEKKNKTSIPLFGLILIDNSDTPVIMPILNTTTENLKAGMRVKVVWANGKLTNTPHIVGFEPI